MIDLLQDFLDSSVRNQWLYYDHMNVYVRKSWRNYKHIRPDLHPTCLDIANVDVEIDFRNQGLFKEFLKHAEDINFMPLIMVESVQNPCLPDFLKSLEYDEYRPSDFIKFNKNCDEYTVWQEIVESLKDK